jgi:predicted dehydrogenase
MNRKWISAILIIFILMVNQTTAEEQNKSHVRLGIAGLTHGHVGWILDAMKKGDVNVVGIAESNREVAERYAKQYGFPMSLVYPTLEEMVAQVQPDGVTAFGPVFDHLQVVEVCAPLHIDVMVEKPLAVNGEHARRMARLARENGIQLMTDYETTWYPTNHLAYRMAVMEKKLGEIHKVIVCDGHQGPKEIQVPPEFLAWLTDPKENGGGAVVDFGCYGANLITWLMQNQKPLSVSATLQTLKPDVYPNVDDEATIILTYPGMQGIIQASWNWPFSRKDMQIYGRTGKLFAANRHEFVSRLAGEDAETIQELPGRPAPYNDPFAWFEAVIKGEIRVNPTDLSSLENNLIVVEILDAARKSARSGKVVHL